MVMYSFFDLIVYNADLEKFKRLSSIPLQGNVFWCCLILDQTTCVPGAGIQSNCMWITGVVILVLPERI